MSSQMEMDVNRLHSFAIKSKKERKNILKFFFCKKTKRNENCSGRELQTGTWKLIGLDWKQHNL